MAQSAFRQQSGSLAGKEYFTESGVTSDGVRMKKWIAGAVLPLMIIALNGCLRVEVARTVGDIYFTGAIAVNITGF